MPDYMDFETTTGWMTIPGLATTNCRHSWGSYFPGISTPPPSEEELAAQHERDTATTNYKWHDSRGVEHERDFTLRDALDRQRLLERRMRDTRSEARAQQVAGQEDEYRALKIKYRNQRAEYTRFADAMGIQPQWERVYMDGLGRI